MTYIRFGMPPENGFSTNHLTHELEKGVSVYEAVERDGVLLPIFPSLKRSAAVSLAWVLDRPCYLVAGEIVGFGSDGEPLMKIQNLTPISNSIPLEHP